MHRVFRQVLFRWNVAIVLPYLWGVLDLRRLPTHVAQVSGTAKPGQRRMKSAPRAAAREAQDELSARLSGFRFSSWRFRNEVFSTVVSQVPQGLVRHSRRQANQTGQDEDRGSCSVSRADGQTPNADRPVRVRGLASLMPFSNGCRTIVLQPPTSGTAIALSDSATPSLVTWRQY